MLWPGLTISHAQMLSQLVNAYVDKFEVSLPGILPKDSMLSVAYDCWTSPFQQSFLAICGYYINSAWRLHEVVLGFQPLYGTHLGKSISRKLFRVLEKHRVTDRLYTITTDNASNNNHISRYAVEICSNHTKGWHLPSLAHVLLLVLQDHLSAAKAGLTNDSDIETYSNKIAVSLNTTFGVGAVL